MMHSGVLTDPLDIALVRAIRGNLYAFFRYLGQSPATDYHEDAGMVRWRTPLRHPWFNGVLCTAPASHEAAHMVADAIAYFREHDVAIFTWWLDNDVASGPWERPLLAQGLRYDDNTPGMAIDLDEIAGARPAPDGLTIRRVEDEAMLRVWTRTFLEGYELPAAWDDDLFALLRGLGYEWPLAHYLGTWRGEPVATANVFYGAGVAGIQFVAVKPAARGRGIGASLSLAPLAEARDAGYRVGILQSSEMGYPVYRSLGFDKYCYMEHYFWREGQVTP
jgi:GNAT superfamily N-acetyltransferase